MTNLQQYAEWIDAVNAIQRSLSRPIIKADERHWEEWEKGTTPNDYVVALAYWSECAKADRNA